MNPMAYNLEEVFVAEKLPEPLPEVDTFLGWLESSKSERFEKRSQIRQQRSLIDNFIQNDPKIQPVRGVLHDISLVQEDKESPVPKAEMIVSETLAKIYYQQKKYQMAMETYEKLGLVYPEKSAYFARLIDKIEKETENR